MHSDQNKKIEFLKNILETQQSNTSLSSGALDFVKFLNLSETDEDVARRLTELSTSPRAELIAYGKEKGFNFTEEDMDTISNEIFSAANELSDDDLDEVAGGVFDAVLAGAAVVSAGAAVVAAATMVASGVTARW